MKKTWMLGLVAATALTGACNKHDATTDRYGNNTVDSRDTTARNDTMRSDDDKLTPKSVEGIASDVDKDSFKVKTAAGDTVKLKVPEGTMIDGKPFSTSTLTEGSQVRASYMKDGMDNKVQSIENLGAPSKDLEHKNY